jgi:hypothetical protein
MAQKVPYIVAELGKDAYPFMLRRTGRKGATTDFGANEGSLSSQTSGRRTARQSGECSGSGKTRPEVQSEAADMFDRKLLPFLNAIWAFGATTIGAKTITSAEFDRRRATDDILPRYRTHSPARNALCDRFL